MSKPETTPTRRVLSAGETLMVHVPRGSTWTVLEGTLQLHDAPRWLDGQIVQLTHRLPPGVPHRTDDEGWVTLRAPARAVVLYSEPAGALDAAFGAVWRIIHALRRVHAAA